jgi:Flp pilus assembly pilin Flp
VSVSAGIDRVLGWLKWPVAVASFVLLPGLAFALYRVVRVIYLSPAPSYAFLAGALAYAVLWYLLLRRGSVGGFFMTLEHELTHALFAWATLHRVIGFRATMRSGGHIRYLGRGNWLITIAPYFFPTLSIIAIAALHWLPDRDIAYGGAILGATVAYHLLSTWSETHRHQTDLQDVGFLFSALFLPAANAIVYGLVLGFVAGLAPATYLREIPDATRTFFRGVAAALERL